MYLMNQKTSMQLDFENKKQTELESLCGYVIKEAKSLGVEVPKMEDIYNDLKSRI